MLPEPEAYVAPEPVLPEPVAYIAPEPVLPEAVLPDPEPVAKAVGEPKWDGTLPATFVYDASGNLVRSFLGRADPAKIKAASRAALRRSSSSSGRGARARVRPGTDAG